ncbi:MAG: TIGR00341 family protein [Bacteroidota bacterium]|nr:TIGR00341 family protein [Bacteroidota bacterium]
MRQIALIRLIRKFLHYFNLEAEIDDLDKIHETISKDIVFKGTNLWILIFAIIIASIGLNMNSNAVIIGAMLISPLMGPINGMGYSIATYDFPLFKRALKNFTFAVIASLVASTTYFALSPISTAHSELLARTSPTIYDVLIALFGGLAGIVAISSKQKGNVIPGVAIATALMPPLCTAGYGLATGQFYYFFGAIYLFTINTVFIAISSVAISQILKFPMRTITLEAQKKKVNRLISVVITLILIPSIYFGYNLVQKEKFSEKASQYVKNVSIVEGNYLLKNEIDATKRTITLVYGGSNMNEDQKERIKETARDFSLINTEIIFQQGLSFDFLNTKNSEVENLKGEMNRLTALLKEKENLMDSIYESRLIGKQILDEIKYLYPQIISCSYAGTYLFNDTVPDSSKMGIVAFATKGKPIKDIEKEKIDKWIKARMKTNKIKVYYENIY